MQLEKIILKNLLRNEKYARKTLPFLIEDYFQNEEKIIFTEIKNFILKYNNLPTYDAIYIELDSLHGLTQDQVNKIKNDLKEIQNDAIDTNMDWLVSSTENFCQERAIYNAIMKSINIINNTEKNLTKGSIPKLLSDALSVSFDPNVGHDYFENADDSSPPTDKGSTTLYLVKSNFRVTW